MELFVIIASLMKPEGQQGLAGSVWQVSRRLVTC